VDHQEFFASPGAYNFTETDISTFVTGGMIGNGLFTLFARKIFSPATATYQFIGETNVAGRLLLRYDYQVSLLVSNYLIKSLGEAKVGYHGSFWADSKTFDLVRLDIQADDIPYAVGVLAAATRIDYGPVRIGAPMFSAAERRNDDALSTIGKIATTSPSRTVKSTSRFRYLIRCASHLTLGSASTSGKSRFLRAWSSQPSSKPCSIPTSPVEAIVCAPEWRPTSNTRALCWFPRARS
jgi:hypothetical protein